MKECWVYLTEWNKKIVTESLENGVDAIVTTAELAPKVRELGRIRVIAESGGDAKIPDDVEVVVINNKTDENRVGALLKSKTVIVRTTDWEVIPIENLIPQGGERLFMFVRNLDDAKLAAGIMEKGVAGVALETTDASLVKKVAEYIHKLDSEKIKLDTLEVTRVETIGIGDRVCVDTCSNLNIGEGLLVGNSSQGLFLVHAENVDNPYVAARPFRVNAGAVHAYVRIPGNKTRYLGELTTGAPVLIASNKGETYAAYVGRAKVEKRPMLVVYAKSASGKEHSIVLQNAETIRLTNTDGKPVSVVQLKAGDKVLGVCEEGGRHFGMAVSESITEK